MTPPGGAGRNRFSVFHPGRLGGLLWGVGLSLAWASALPAAVYYVAPSGGADTPAAGTSAQPWATLKYASGRLAPGDTLILRDGVYAQALDLYNYNYAPVTGTPRAVITFRAEHDGQAVLDGTVIPVLPEKRRGCIFLEKVSYVEINGLRVRNPCDLDHPGVCSAIWILPHLVESAVRTGNWVGEPGSESHHITLRRVTAQVTAGAYGLRASVGSWNPLFNLQGADDEYDPGVNPTVYTQQILLEDCAAYGWGIHSLLVDHTTHHITVRRFFGLWEGWEGGTSTKYPWCQNIEIYGGHEVLIENAVVFTRPNQALYDERAAYYYNDANDPTHAARDRLLAMHLTPERPALGKDLDGVTPLALGVQGILLPGRNQALLGSVVYEGGGLPFSFESAVDSVGEHNVSIRPTYGGVPKWALSAQRSRFDNPFTGTVAGHFTLIDIEAQSQGAVVGGGASPNQPGDDFTVQNTYVQGPDDGRAFAVSGASNPATFTHAHNRYSPNLAAPYVNTAPGADEAGLAAAWDTAAYGDGAYLMASRTNLAGLGADGSAIGADVLYRYASYYDGADVLRVVATAEALWPWPLEDRIRAECGVSVTWAAAGGIWKTLTGAYPEPPAAPRGFRRR